MDRDIVGLIPAAGLAKRIAPLPCSKELLPIGFREVNLDGRVETRVKTISQYLLDNMVSAGAKRIWIVLGRHKSDIMQYYGDGTEIRANIAYLMIDNLWGMPYTLDQAYPWLNGETVLFGMPDTIFTPSNAFVRMLELHKDHNSDVTLGIFPTDRPEKLCPVVLDEDGHIINMTDKPTHSIIRNTWGCACWSPRFSAFMHEHLSSLQVESREVVLASVFRAAIRAGLKMDGLCFGEGEYIDIGTPEDLAATVQRFSAY